MARWPMMCTLILPLALAGCGGCSSPPETCTGSQPPAAPVDGAFPLDFIGAPPRTDSGAVILIQSNATLGGGLSLVLAYDETLDDPITRWADCLGRVNACYQSNCGAIAGCVDAIPRCASANGGPGCCPSACIEAFHAALDGGTDEPTALTRSFLAGECIPGFSAMRATADAAPAPVDAGADADGGGP
jgi:hypothetical protein